jgi:L-seryl-tRNA(Ser) seleniumtransferase
MPNSATSLASLLRNLPSVDQLLRTKEALALRDSVGPRSLAALARAVTDQLRQEIQSNGIDVDGRDSQTSARESLLAEAVRRLEAACRQEQMSGIRRVINATGVMVHTNLGRAPLSDAARLAVAREAAGYCTLEYDLTTGERGRRGRRVEDLLIELAGAEDALIVNNCAAAALLILTVLARDGETIVSRGELVEIGGDFRVPDVMANSGTRMIEVGTTNRTKLDDYGRALNDETRLIMRVHQSNYRIIGFTSAPSISQLAALAHEAELPLYVDAGSGALTDLKQYGLADEPVISDCIAQGADVVSFSGDKLLGGSQAGLIVGKGEVIGRLRKHPLYRALRADKLCLVALHATLEAHRRGCPDKEVPVLRMLRLTQAEIEQRAKTFVESYRQTARKSDLDLEIIDGTSAIGGGSGPNTHPPTALVAIRHRERSADEIEQGLRLSSPPIITRIAEGRVLIDLRTVESLEEIEIIKALSHLTR